MLPLYLILMPLIVLFCGLSLDSSMLELKKIQMQSAADAAAYGAELEYERNTGNWVSMGQQDAAVNGFTNGQNNVTITVAQQPTYGAYKSYNDTIQVTISQTVQTYFMGALNGGKVTVTASAASRIPPCGFAMNTTGSGTGFTLYETNVTSTCPIYANSTVNVDSSSWIEATALDVTGVSSASSDNGRTTPSPQYSAPTLADPLAWVAAPTPASTCTVLPTINGPGSLTVVNLTPGTYCGPSNGPVTWAQANAQFSPGMYIFEGGMNVTNSMLQGSGVTLYFTKNSAGSYGQVYLHGNSSILISAPTTSSNGSVPGVLYFFDRNWPTTASDLNCNDSLLQGSGIYYGVKSGFYFVDCSIWPETFNGFDSNSFTFDYTVFADTAGINFSSNYSNISGGNPFRSQSVLVQ